MSKAEWVAIGAIAVVSNLGALFFGADFKLALLAALVIAWVALAVLVWRREARLRSVFPSLSREQQEAVLAGLAENAAPFGAKLNNQYAADYRWAVVSIGLGMGLPLILPGIIAGPLMNSNFTWDSSLSPAFLPLMAGGLVAYFLIRRALARRYRCRQCGEKPQKVGSTKLLFWCARCNILWNTFDRRYLT